MNVTEILMAYSEGSIGIADANRMLEESKSGLKLDPYKNIITASEYLETHTSDDPTKCTGYGFMNHGIGTPEKMYVKEGKFNYDTGFGHGASATFYIGGKAFKVVGDHIEVMH